MTGAIVQFLMFLILFLALPAIYVIGFIKITSWILKFETKSQKVFAVAVLILSLPVLVYIHLILMYVAGGGH